MVDEQKNTRTNSCFHAPRSTTVIDHVNDAELVTRARATDPDARASREELVHRHVRRIRALCWSRLPRHGPVDDMVQETFLRGFRLLGELERPAAFGSFLAGIAVRVCADWRKAKARHEVSLDEDPTQESPTSAGTDDESLRNAMRALPEIYRDTLALFYFAERSYLEIAATLGITEATVNARLAQGRKLLRERLTRGAS